MRRLVADLIGKKPLGALGAAVVLALFVLAVFADVLAPSHYGATAPRDAFTRPGPGHWFGTDQLGRDVLSRIIYGSRISLLVSLAPARDGAVFGVPSWPRKF